MITTYLCPVCKNPMEMEYGQGQLHVGDERFGLTLFCNSKNCKVEVFGHSQSKKVEDAYETILDRMKFATGSSK